MIQERTAGPQYKPLILDIKRGSLDDGPGIRSVVFFKGCPLTCIWCHNPESKNTEVEISFDPKECIGCGACLSECPRGALSKDNRYYIDRQACNLCFECMKACHTGALSRVGQQMEVEEIVAAVLVDKPFFDISSGGVTLSGGEPTLGMDYTSQLLEQLKSNKVNTLLETCGQFDLDRFMIKLYPYLDAIYYDIKLLDADVHKRYCGVSNAQILDNFIKLHEVMADGSKTLLPRIPLIPEITDTDDNIAGIARFLHSIGVKTAALLAYNPLWHDKNDKIGVADPWRDDKMMGSWPAHERLARCKEILLREGIDT